ncbi:DedA family protein [Priestia koreensis]|uniref:Alkaline phosphatase n=1 Tax=Priestia koreensis TaxID=284581 RepID=A0A0M0LHF7_9BACI|nr:DedA family protein [Priestia koreensis]KOO50464.1 alkaline phosphatase [Priestia koreensis]
MEQWIFSFIEFFKQFSYFGIIFALTFEFVPAEIVLPMAGFWVYEGDMNLWLTVLAGTIGGVTGPLTLYFIGRWGGRPFLEKYGKYFFIKDKQLDAADTFFARHGGAVAFTARFLPGVRTLISIPCGMAKMNVLAFSLYTFFAMLPVTFFYVYLGYKLGPHWEDVGKIMDRYTLPIVIGIIILIVIYILIKRKKRKSRYSVKEFLTKK